MAALVESKLRRDICQPVIAVSDRECTNKEPTAVLATRLKSLLDQRMIQPQAYLIAMMNVVVTGEGTVPKVELAPGQPKLINFGSVRAGEKRSASVRVQCKSKIPTPFNLVVPDLGPYMVSVAIAGAKGVGEVLYIGGSWYCAIKTSQLDSV